MKGRLTCRLSGAPDAKGTLRTGITYRRGFFSRRRTETHEANVSDFEMPARARTDLDYRTIQRWTLASIGLRFIPDSVKYKDVGEMNDEACSLGEEVVKQYMDAQAVRFRHMPFPDATEAVLGLLAREEMLGKKREEFERHYETLQEARVQRALSEMETKNPSRSYIEDVIGGGMDCTGRNPETNQPKYRERGWTTKDAHSTWIMPAPMAERTKRWAGVTF